MGRLKISIALVTYNRGDFLKEQLRSIVAQERLPDELVVGDDCSTDSTLDIISEFALQVPFPVYWYVNDHNEGYSRNLDHAIRLCSGDVIVLCDDDDVCMPGKLKVTEEEFGKCSAAGLMIGNSALVDDKRNPLGVTLWDAIGFTRRQTESVLEDPICTLARHFVAAGHVMSFRGMLKRFFLPFPQTLPPGVFCDVWIALVLASIARVICFPQPLVEHRLHGGQIAGVRTLVSSKERKKARARERRRIAEFMPLIESVINRVSALADNPLAGPNLVSLTDWAKHMQMQSRLPQARHRRLLRIVHALFVGRYHRYSRGCLTAARDLLLLQ